MIQGTIGFLGYGNMGAAILMGLIEAGQTTGKHAVVFDPSPARCTEAAQLGAELVDSPVELAARADILLLAVKPQTMEEALAPVRGVLRPDALVISIAAGIPIARLRAMLGDGARIIRVMPNTPALVGAGAAGIAPGPGCTAADTQVARAIFESIGAAEIVKEEDMDAVTAVSGSGPAYFFHMVECLAAAGAAAGLDEELAARLAAQTLLGAGLLLKSSGESAACLRERVTSKGGTTEAALNTLHERDFADAVRAAGAAAAARSRKLGA